MRRTLTKEELQDWRRHFAKTHKPHMLCKDTRGDLWEFISYPYVENGQIVVKARIPGDPTSMFTAEAVALHPEGRPCMCADAGKDFYLATEYYRKRHARLAQCPARVE